MKYIIKPSNKFRKELRKVEKRGYNISLITQVIKNLANGEKLEAKYNDHSLMGKYKGCRECHITPDWLLIYEIVDDELKSLLHSINIQSQLTDIINVKELSKLIQLVKIFRR